jgi:CRISPR system Cascade subunit CasA
MATDLSPATAAYDLLTDSLFTVAPSDDPVSLPQVLARLLANDGAEVQEFPNVAVEQQGHWWRLLVRCAARALRESGMTLQEATASTADDLAQRLRAALRELAPEGAWMLYQPHLARPGFLQVPVPNEDLAAAGYKPRTLALLTGLLGEKYHERKAEVDRMLDIERTVYALIEYQTAAIYGGRGNYASQLTGSASGAGSGTPFVGAWIDESYRETFRHDVGVMLSTHDSIRHDLGLRGVVWALWTQPWDGDTSLEVEELDPAFIPLARRVRLGPPNQGRFNTVWFAASRSARVSDARAGNLGDPFIPVVPNPQAGKKGQPAEKARGALSGDVRIGGYDYREMARLLFGEKSRLAPSVAALASRVGETKKLMVRFWGIAYAQGKTEGVSRRVLPLPAYGDQGHAARLVRGDEATIRARETHAWLLEQVRNFKNALTTSLRVFLHGLDDKGRIPNKKPTDDKLLSAAGGEFELRVDGGHDDPDQDGNAGLDSSYFDHLFRLALAAQDASGLTGSTAAAQQKVAAGRWLERIAREVFDSALPALPVPTTRRFKHEAEARDILNVLLAKCREETDAAADRPPEEDDDEEL